MFVANPSASVLALEAAPAQVLQEQPAAQLLASFSIAPSAAATSAAASSIEVVADRLAAAVALALSAALVLSCAFCRQPLIVLEGA